MTNMVPQSVANNREVWKELESYSRKLDAIAILLE
jgi:DNA/RNA endonuclease G (NUC1)